MTFSRHLIFLALFGSLLVTWAAPSHELQFPPGFIFGAATAAYQIEGAWNEDGKGLTIWDVFSQTPGKVVNGETGNQADDHYHRVESDVEIIAGLGLSHYRMSLSWARIFPSGYTDQINQAGVEYYLKEFRALKAKGIKPFVTLYHWDLPQGIEDNGGWLNASSVSAFAAYANASFALFGEFVDQWSTFNEPWVISWHGYGTGEKAPGRCSDRAICNQGNSSTEPYIVGHHLLLAHAAAVDLYRKSHQAHPPGHPQGKIGMVINSDFAAPVSDSAEDKHAAQRYLEFACGWFAHPVYFGDYPASMRATIGDRLPQFSAAEREQLAGSVDFFGLNHYSTIYAAAMPSSIPPLKGGGWFSDLNIRHLRHKDGKQIGPIADCTWHYVVPWGMRGILNWIKTTYDNPPILITENGVAAPQESLMSKEEAVQDVFRQYFLKSYLENVLLAIKSDNVNVQGYFAWSLMDNFEWSDGYKPRFGLVYVDYSNNFERIEKGSAMWYRRLIKYNRENIVEHHETPLSDFHVLPQVRAETAL